MPEDKKKIKKYKKIEVKTEDIQSYKKGVIGRDGVFYKSKDQAENIGGKNYRKAKMKAGGDYSKEVESMDEKYEGGKRRYAGSTTRKKEFEEMKKRQKKYRKY
jgi:hypothetical protein